MLKRQTQPPSPGRVSPSLLLLVFRFSQPRFWTRMSMIHLSGEVSEQSCDIRTPPDSANKEIRMTYL
jgi:hypothetical protein